MAALFMGIRYDTVKEAAQMALQARKAIKNGNFTPFIPALAMAIAKDGILDIVSAIPLFGLVTTFLGLFITVYLFIFLFGKGKWKVRIVIFSLSLFDVIPVVGLLPFSTICVLYAYHQAKKLADRAKKELPEIVGIQTNAQMIREYQMTQTEAAREEQAEAEQQEMAQQEPQTEESQSGSRGRLQVAPVQTSSLRTMSDVRLPESATFQQPQKSSDVMLRPFVMTTNASNINNEAESDVQSKNDRVQSIHSDGGRVSSSDRGASMPVLGLPSDVSLETIGEEAPVHEKTELVEIDPGIDLMRKEKENGVPLLREAQEHKNKILEGRDKLQMSKEDYEQYFSSDEFAVHEGLQQQNIGNCYAVAAIHAFSEAPNFEMMVRSSMKRSSDGTWEVKLPLMDKNAQTVTVSPNDLQGQRNIGFLKRHGGIKNRGGVLPDLRRTLKPLQANEGICALQVAFAKKKFKFPDAVNWLALEGGQGKDVLMQLGGKENFVEWYLDSAQYDDEGKRWTHPGLSTLPEEKMRYLDHMLETFDPDVYIATVNTKHLDKSKLSSKVLDALGLPFYKATGANKLFIAGHAYSLTKVDKERKMVVLANPWDTRKPIELTFQQFKETFSAVSAVRINHANLLENMKSLHPTNDDEAL